MKLKKVTLFIAVLLLTAFNYTAEAIVSKTVACTAGNLATLAANYLTTVTNLTVTGTIDSRDFKTMHYSMTALAVLDLHGATIVGYTGTDGTAGTVLTSAPTVYPANEIPSFAFTHPVLGDGKVSLKTFVFPSGVTSIAVMAFYNCWGLVGSLTIPSTVKTIADYAFHQCNNVAGSLTIPSSVTSIGDYAFEYCGGLTSIYASATTPIDISTKVNVFLNVNKTSCILHVPVGSKAKYAAAIQWKDFVNIVDDIPTSIDEVLSSSIAIFPNPATSIITVSELSSIATDKTVTLSVNDVSGSTLLIKDVDPNANALTIDVSAFNNGVYFVVIQTSKGRVVKRFVKE